MVRAIHSRRHVSLLMLTSFIWLIPGIVIVLFFSCIAALLDPVQRRREGIKWGLVSYTTVMFAFVTVFTAMNLNVQSIAFIDNREFPGIEGVVPPGPLGYQWFIYSRALSVTPNVMFLLNNWLADGLLVGSFLGAILSWSDTQR